MGKGGLLERENGFRLKRVSVGSMNRSDVADSFLLVKDSECFEGLSLDELEETSSNNVPASDSLTKSTIFTDRASYLLAHA